MTAGDSVTSHEILLGLLSLLLAALKKRNPGG